MESQGHDRNRGEEKAAHHGLAEFFSFPQFSTTESSESRRWAVADIEVSVVDSHANLKIMAKRRPRLLLNLAAGLQALCLGILHLNVTTADQMVLYSVSVKVCCFYTLFILEPGKLWSGKNVWLKFECIYMCKMRIQVNLRWEYFDLQTHYFSSYFLSNFYFPWNFFFFFHPKIRVST